MDLHEACKVMPEMPEEQYQNLKANIKEHGLLTPILTYEGKILDGRHRLKACAELGLRPQFEEYLGPDPFEHVWALNVERRQLPPTLRAILRLSLDQAKNRYVERARAAQGRRTDLVGEVGPSQAVHAQLARETGVSNKTAQRVVEASTIPELAAAMQAGKVTARTAERLRKVDPEVRSQALTLIEQGESPTVALRQAKGAQQRRSGQFARREYHVMTAVLTSVHGVDLDTDILRATIRRCLEQIKEIEVATLTVTRPRHWSELGGAAEASA